MKFIEDGKLYNTEKAELLIDKIADSNSTDLLGLLSGVLTDYSSYKVYKTKKGTYFIIAIPTKVSEKFHRGILGDEQVAKEKLEVVLFADEYIKIFGEVEEG